MGRFLRKGVLFTLLFAGLVAPASADPIIMLLLSVARQIAEAQANKPAAPVVLPEMSRYYPGTTVEPEHLKSLIDDCFIYLSFDQRREIFNSLNAALLDPRNAAVRGTMIEYFASKALTIRAAQQQLANLSWQDKERLANEFRQEVATLPAEDQAELGKLLRSGMLPVPSDFNQLLIAAFDAR
ncbi:MAG TPA: hypothetical protein VKS43_16715 [Burkholderiales bacterium]|nr:hypothetical protein [Burkholderiales bacterium]